MTGRYLHGESELARQPGPAECISVSKASGGRVKLRVRRGPVRMKFPLSAADIDHLVALLQKARPE